MFIFLIFMNDLVDHVFICTHRHFMLPQKTLEDHLIEGRMGDGSYGDGLAGEQNNWLVEGPVTLCWEEQIEYWSNQ
jgi:hypothetical protein